jgi:phytoene dehydrogenase-like protein
MKHNGRKIVIIGGGIAGLSAAVYALRCGYQVEILEMNDMAGGLATSWKRGGYTFETCLHWLVGSKPGGEMHDLWRELFDFEKLSIINSEEFVRIQDESGDSLSIYTDVDRLEAELLRRAPQDAVAIHGFTGAVRSFGNFKMLDPAGGLADNWLNLLRDAHLFPLFGKLSKMSGQEYAKRFSDPLLRSFFGDGEMGKMSAIAMVFSLAFMNTGNAGYAIGGSQAMIRLIENKIASLGGTIRFKAKVARILVEHDVAVGVELSDGTAIMADWVISAADGHSTIFDLLGGQFLDSAVTKIYNEKELFPSYLQVSLGVARDLSGQPYSLTKLLDAPIKVDPATELDRASFRFFHFDPTFAPPGKTAITSFLPTPNFTYWTDLRLNDLNGYRDEKHRVAEAIIAELEKCVPGIRPAIEVVDVSTPASVIRYTGNWKGSMEGWQIMPGASFRPLPNTLPGLRRFHMVGQWVLPGGGLPSGPLTAKVALKAICKQDHVPYTIHEQDSVAMEMIGV